MAIKTSTTVIEVALHGQAGPPARRPSMFTLNLGDPT
jgi:hypothetical protein